MLSWFRPNCMLKQNLKPYLNEIVLLTTFSPHFYILLVFLIKIYLSNDKKFLYNEDFTTFNTLTIKTKALKFRYYSMVQWANEKMALTLIRPSKSTLGNPISTSVSPRKQQFWRGEHKKEGKLTKTKSIKGGLCWQQKNFHLCGMQLSCP